MMVIVVENRARKAFNEPLYVSYTSESQIPYRKHNLPRAAVTPLRCRLSALSDQTVGFPITGRYQAMVPMLKTPYSGRTRASARSDRCSDQEFAAPREAPHRVHTPKIRLTVSALQTIGPMGRGGLWDNSPAPEPPHESMLLTPESRYRASRCRPPISLKMV